MTAAGEAVVARARESGAWDTLSGVEALEIPLELRKALTGNVAARKNWPEYTRSQQKQFLYWLQAAKREPTRAARIAAIVEAVSRRITATKAYDELKLRRPASDARAPSPDRRQRK
jgi:uncharacterized protein YdeI (YjbR/CyaY-like superfamily)